MSARADPTLLAVDSCHELEPSFHGENADARDPGFCRSAKEPSASCISCVPVLRTCSTLHHTLSVCKHITPSKRGRSKRKRKGRGREGERKKRRGKGVAKTR